MCITHVTTHVCPHGHRSAQVVARTDHCAHYEWQKVISNKTSNDAFMRGHGITLRDWDRVKEMCIIQKRSNSFMEVHITTTQCDVCRRYNVQRWRSNPHVTPTTVPERPHIRVDTNMIVPRSADVPHSVQSAVTPWLTDEDNVQIQHNLATTPQNATPITPTHIQHSGPNLTVHPSGVDRLRRSGIQTIWDRQNTQAGHGSGIRNEDIGAFPTRPVQGDNQQHAPVATNWWKIRSKRR
jgi:hypothetical protein